MKTEQYYYSPTRTLKINHLHDDPRHTSTHYGNMTSPPHTGMTGEDRFCSASLQRGAGTELVVEMQDLLNVTHARAVLGRGIPGAYAQISLQRLTRCLHGRACFGMPCVFAHVCCGMRGRCGLETETTPHETQPLTLIVQGNVSLIPTFHGSTHLVLAGDRR